MSTRSVACSFFLSCSIRRSASTLTFVVGIKRQKGQAPQFSLCFPKEADRIFNAQSDLPLEALVIQSWTPPEVIHTVNSLVDRKYIQFFDEISFHSYILEVGFVQKGFTA
jgi:hypothetical protein